MPCYEVRTLSVEFSAAHRDLLDSAISSLGWSLREWADGRLVIPGKAITLDLAAGRAEVADGQQSALNELKRAYSREALKRAAQLKRWRISSTDSRSGVILRSQ